MTTENLTRRKPAYLSAALMLTTLGLSSAAQAGTAFVQLFEWKWSDVAQECEKFLGPKGFEAVQVSPPNEHITNGNWWARYQPVSYQLESRSGNRAQFIEMVQRCDAAGVKIYVDAIINHTAAMNSGGTGTGGTNWSLKSHPMYSSQDYHNTCSINYGDAGSVHYCEVTGLPDLDTSSNYVQQQLADYMNELTSIGVAGFRIDAAKHMSPGDLQGIYSRLNGSPYIFQEVIRSAGEPVQPEQYNHMADVTEMKFSTDLADNFSGQIKNLNGIGQDWGMLASDDAVVFVDNHDKQRGHGGGGVLTYKDGSTYDLANVFMLAWPYGYPKVMSSYAFDDTDQGPPSSSVHNGSSLNCFGSEWKCEHRWQAIGNMVAFRNATQANRFTSDWWDNGNNQIAFGRGDKGFVVINNEGGALNRTFNTSLAAGEYCNIAVTDFANNTCSGEVLTVNGDGTVQINVAAYSAAAIHVAAEMGGSTTLTDPTIPSDTWYFRGTSNGWATKELSFVSGSDFETCQTFSDANSRFKIDHNGDWSESYPSADYLVTSGTSQLIKFNSVSKSISTTQVDNCDGSTTPSDPTPTDPTPTDPTPTQPSDTWYFRGTSNAWGTTALTFISGSDFETCQSFTDADAGFKIDHTGDWGESYPSSDYLVTTGTSQVIKFNSESKSISVTQVESCDGSTGGSTNTTTVTIHYQRSDNNYSGWGLHLWGDALASTDVTTWNSPKSFDNNDNWGRLAQIYIEHSDLVLNFIIHNGDNKDTDVDRSYIPGTNAEIWIKSNDTTLYTSVPGAGGTGEGSTDGHGMELGAKYSSGSTKFSIWSPDTGNVQLWLDGQTYSMTRQSDDATYQNVYSVTVNGDHHLKEYSFKINGFTVRDPYGVMVKPNTDVNIVMDLSRTEPTGGWAARPNMNEREDAVIYETHVRDFTIDASSGVSSDKRGRFMGMVEHGTNLNGMATGIDHLVEMGITHVQLLPVYDFGSCADVNDTSCYNWGYDPRNYSIPEERYSMSQDYEQRVREFKEMVNEYHKAGIRVVMDVVYNHTYAKEMFGNISGQYYTDTDLSGTGNSIDANVPMVGQMILDSLDYWVREYNIDGFRFDLIGIFDYDEVGHWIGTLNSRYPGRNLLVYGEPWNGYASDPRDSERVRLGTIARIEGAHVGVFNPKYREAIKGQNDKGSGGGFAFNQGKGWEMRMGSRGAIRYTNAVHETIDTWDPMFATDPEQAINYVSAHDNLVLRDKILLWADENGVDRGSDYLRRIQRFANGIVLTSQGIPFIHSGAEFMRDKQGHHNSYNAGDEINKIRWQWKGENADIYNYYKKVIAMRKSHPGFRLNTWDEINNNMTTEEISDSLVVNKINGSANGDNWKNIIVIYNSGNNLEYALPAGEWKVALEKSDANLGNDRSVYASITSEGTSVTVLYQE